VIGFASIQGGAPASVGALTDHLLNLTLNSEHGRVADYYARTGRPLSEEERTAGLFRAEEGPSVESGALRRTTNSAKPSLSPTTILAVEITGVVTVAWPWAAIVAVPSGSGSVAPVGDDSTSSKVWTLLHPSTG
jgi:hypothetical protein